MKFSFAHNETDILVVKDFDGANPGLVGQLITEIEILKQELIDIYREVDYDD